MNKSTHDSISTECISLTAIVSGLTLKNHLLFCLFLLFLTSYNNQQGSKTNSETAKKNELTMTYQMMDEDQFRAIIESTKIHKPNYIYGCK